VRRASHGDEGERVALICTPSATVHIPDSGKSHVDFPPDWNRSAPQTRLRAVCMGNSPWSRGHFSSAGETYLRQRDIHSIASPKSRALLGVEIRFVRSMDEPGRQGSTSRAT
jgi:hypothetical protein